MTTTVSDDAGAARQRRRLTAAIKQALRDLRVQLALLNQRIVTRLELRPVDLDCLELIGLQGPLSPSALARRAGLHPATMTGILDRLERGGWVVRERDPSDRRAVVLRLQRDRGAELVRLYAAMNDAMDQTCAGFNQTELETIAAFLRRTAEAGRSATDELAAD